MQAAGVQEVVLAANHLRQPIKAYFGDGSGLGIRLYYSNEDKPLGTAGALGNMLHLLDETFFLTDGDLLTTMDLRGMALTHISERADASIGIYERENTIDFGLIEFDTNKRLSAYCVKSASKYYISMGVYILQREAVRDHVSNVDYLDVPDLLLKIRANNGSVVCFQNPCIWLDIGRPDRFVGDRDALFGHA